MKRRLHLRRTNSSIRRSLIVILKKEQWYLCVDNTYSYTDRPFNFISFLGGYLEPDILSLEINPIIGGMGWRTFGLPKKNRYSFFFKLYKRFSLTTTYFFYFVDLVNKLSSITFGHINFVLKDQHCEEMLWKS